MDLGTVLYPDGENLEVYIKDKNGVYYQLSFAISEDDNNKKYIYAAYANDPSIKDSINDVSFKDPQRIATIAISLINRYDRTDNKRKDAAIQCLSGRAGHNN